MKVDLAIYSHVLGISRWCKSVGLILSNKLDLISCAIKDGFINPVIQTGSLTNGITVGHQYIISTVKIGLYKL